jgi:hypothetical protein
MFAAERITSQPMIEFTLAILPKHEFKVAPVVLHMAILTVAILGLRMEPAPTINA